MLKDRNLNPSVNDKIPTAEDLAKRLGEGVTPTVPQNQLDLELAVTSDLPYTSKHAVKSGLAVISDLSHTSKHAVKSEFAATSELNTKFCIAAASNVADTPELAATTNLAVSSDLSSTSNLASKSMLTPKSNLAAVSNLADTPELAVTTEIATTSVVAPTSQITDAYALATTSELPSKFQPAASIELTSISKLVDVKATNLTDVDSVLTTSLNEVNLQRYTPVPMKINHVKEICEEIITAGKNESLIIEKACEMYPSASIDISADTTANIDKSTETNTEQQIQEPLSNLPIHTIPVTNINWLIELLILFSNSVAKRAGFSLAVIISISYIIGYTIDEQSLYLSVAKLLYLIPLMWVRQSDEITKYFVRKITNLIRTLRH